MEELWKEVPGYKGKYLISNYGRVISKARYIGNGKGYFMSEHIVKQYLDKYGYWYVMLIGDNRRRFTTRIHKLVCRVFNDWDASSNVEVCHIDGNKNNNRYDNLYCGNHRSNTLDKYRQGKTKLTVDDILLIKELSKTEKQETLARRFEVKQSYISRIISGIRCQYVKPETQIEMQYK